LDVYVVAFFGEAGLSLGDIYFGYYSFTSFAGLQVGLSIF
jgi:hypothetical protein